eukprot:gb/GFBE01059655.1/.p1 GENE.gb/GFBE01059655.1/~~gb/GFBE01059655.1/.p1  ORF type:complete len:196 (+),score=72.05 gb/GFBE01059655.1/:1-588(+)
MKMGKPALFCLGLVCAASAKSTSFLPRDASLEQEVDEHPRNGNVDEEVTTALHTFLSDLDDLPDPSIVAEAQRKKKEAQEVAAAAAAAAAAPVVEQQAEAMATTPAVTAPPVAPAVEELKSQETPEATPKVVKPDSALRGSVAKEKEASAIEIERQPAAAKDDNEEDLEAEASQLEKELAEAKANLLAVKASIQK